MVDTTANRGGYGDTEITARFEGPLACFAAVEDFAIVHVEGYSSARLGALPTVAAIPMPFPKTSPSHSTGDNNH